MGVLVLAGGLRALVGVLRMDWLETDLEGRGVFPRTGDASGLTGVLALARLTLEGLRRSSTAWAFNFPGLNRSLAQGSVVVFVLAELAGLIKGMDDFRVFL